MSQTNRKILRTGTVDLSTVGLVVNADVFFEVTHNLGYHPVVQANWFLFADELAYPLPWSWGNDIDFWHILMEYYTSKTKLYFRFVSYNVSWNPWGYIKYYIYKENAV